MTPTSPPRERVGAVYPARVSAGLQTGGNQPLRWMGRFRPHGFPGTRGITVSSSKFTHQATTRWHQRAREVSRFNRNQRGRPSPPCPTKGHCRKPKEATRPSMLKLTPTYGVTTTTTRMMTTMYSIFHHLEGKHKILKLQA